MREGASSETIAGVITGISVSHRTSDISMIERASAADPMHDLEQLLDSPAVDEAFVVQTCNRVERYIVTENRDIGEDVLTSHLPDIPSGSCELFSHEATLEHLFRVSAGLESMVIGEDQILGQLKRARDVAEEVDALGPLLDEVVWKAISVGQRVRTETEINEGINSLSRAALDLAGTHTALPDATVVIVGAGQMGERALNAAVDTDVGAVRLLNRTLDHASTLLNDVEITASAHRLDSFGASVEDADILITATASPDYLISPEDLSHVEQLIAVDIGQPRDIDPRVAQSAHVELFDLDDLESVTADTTRSRRDAMSAAEEIIAGELAHLHTQLKRKQADDVIAALWAEAEQVKARELDEVASQLQSQRTLTDQEAEVLEAFADSLVGKLMAAPTKSLREAAESDDWETIQVALQMFDPAFPSGAATSGDGDVGPSDSIPIEDDRS